MKALSVFSGGLDSMLAAELIRAQGIDVLALFFETPFFHADKARQSAESMGLPFKAMDISERHLAMVKKPKHGYGGNMNPCIDCHALMFRIAGEILEKEKAEFVISGEVLGQRPMSQNRGALNLVAKESALEGLLLRPLSAKLLPMTVPEEQGWVNRDALMNFQGRSRKPQMALAKAFGIREYPSPAGGCLLTEKAFSTRLKDLLAHNPNPKVSELELLRVGRHFRIGPAVKLVVGRNKKENDEIRSLSGEGEMLLTSVSQPGPTVLVAGAPSGGEIELAASITAAYSDTGDLKDVEVRSREGQNERTLSIRVQEKEAFRAYLI